MQMTDLTRTRWFMPVFCLFLGALMFGAFAIGGDAIQGVISFGLMAALAAIFAFARRSETIQGIGGPERDERWAMIDLRATAITGGVLIFAIIAGFLIEVARGQDGSPYALLAAIGGLAYILAIAVLRR